MQQDDAIQQHRGVTVVGELPIAECLRGRRAAQRAISRRVVVTAFELTAMTMWAARDVVKLKLAGRPGLMPMLPTGSAPETGATMTKKVPIWTSQCWVRDEWAARWPSGCSTAATR
jgi:hypothetical protein